MYWKLKTISYKLNTEVCMKKIKRFFSICAAGISLAVYPIACFNWYRLLKKHSDSDRKSFIWYGIWGIAVIFGYVFDFFCAKQPDLLFFITTSVAIVTYIAGYYKTSFLICSKRRFYGKDKVREDGRKLTCPA